MKHLFCLVFTFIFLSCSQNQDVKPKPKPLIDAWSYGNFHLKEKFEKYYAHVIETKDSLSTHDFLKEPRRAVKCSLKRVEDYGNDSVLYKQVDIIINDTLVINILEKDANKVEYIYLYNNRPFTITHKLVEFWTNYNPHFFLDNNGRECWQLGPNKYLMAEAPSAWCGTILQFEFYQVLDLNKMEITQFVDKRFE